MRKNRPFILPYGRVLLPISLAAEIARYILVPGKVGGA